MKINKRVPVPPARREFKSTFATMRLSDSIFVETRTGVNAARIYAKRHQLKFRCKSVEEDGVKGWRIWRVL